MFKKKLYIVIFSGWLNFNLPLCRFCLKRRLRIRTLQYVTTGNINELHDNVDYEAVLSILVHKVTNKMHLVVLFTNFCYLFNMVDMSKMIEHLL